MIKLIKKIINQEYLFSIVSKFLGVFIALFYSVIFNRYLGATMKGEAAIIANYASMISSVVCLGMYQAYPFYRRKNKDEFYPFINNMTSLYFILFVLSLGFAFFAQGVDMNLRIAMILMVIQAYIRHINYVTTIEHPRRRNFASIFINLTDLAVVAVMMIFTTATYTNMVIILLAQVAINLAISYANLKTSFKKLRFTLRKIPQYAKFGFMPMITLFLMTINYRVNILMLENTAGITLAQIGIYSVGMALAEKVWLVPDAIKDILLSKLCKGRGEEEVARVIRINVVITIAMIVALAIVATPLIQFVYGPEYAGADSITVIILLGTISMVFYKMVYSYNISLGKRFVNLLFLGLAAIANVIGNYFFIPLLGINGTAWSSVISYTLCGVCFLIYFRIKSKIPMSKILLIQKEDITMIKSFLGKKKTKTPQVTKQVDGEQGKNDEE